MSADSPGKAQLEKLVLKYTFQQTKEKKMKLKTILFSIMQLLFLAEFIYSLEQEERQNKNRLSILAGTSKMARQDLIYSPFIHSDLSLHSYGIRYQHDGKLLHYVEINFAFNESQRVMSYEMQMDDHSHGLLPHEFLFINTAYGTGILFNEDNYSRQWIGGSFKGEIQAAFYNFMLSEMFGYYIEFSLNAWYRYNYKFSDKHLISAQAEIPLVSWLARPPYLAEDDKFIENISSHNKFKTLLAFIGDGEIVTVNKLQWINLSVEYSYSISKRFSLGAIYRFVFIHSNEPRTLLSYHHNLNLTTSINF